MKIIITLRFITKIIKIDKNDNLRKENRFFTLEAESPPLDIWAVMSTPVRFFTIPGTLVIIVNTSPVNLAAPISPVPSDTIEIFFA